jgi:hypothetical protein
MHNNVWSFGDNYWGPGQLGLGDKENRNIPTKISNFIARKIFAGISSSVITGFETK